MLTASPVLRIGIVCGFLLCLFGCDEDMVRFDPSDFDFVTDFALVRDPTGYAPLSAEATFTATQASQLVLEVTGPEDSSAPVSQRFQVVRGPNTIPVLGLYPGRTNTVTFRFQENGMDLGVITEELRAPLLSPDISAVTINTISPAAIKPGMNLVSSFGHNGEFRPQKPFIFDADGRIRWYFDPTGHPILNDLFYDDGVERLTNGNLYFGDGGTDLIVELDMLGRVINTWAMPGYEFHHNVIEKPDGNFIVTVSKQGEPTVEDYIIEINRITGEIVTEWNLNESLDNTRRSWPTNFADLNVDWFHGNAVAYNQFDDTIIVSGRTQGTVKLTRSNEVVWILAPHVDWATAGNGVDLATKLLQPLDASGQPISDSDVLNGTINHPDFEWAWYQHAPELLPDGRLLLFDNGDNRNFVEAGPYSRAVVYQIDEEAMTIQQSWQYGKERGTDLFSRIVSDVDFHEAENNVVFMPGAVGRGGTPVGKVVEVDFATREVLFEATVTAPTAQFGITFHRVERLSLYP